MKKIELEKYSFGVGDRFAHQAKAQLGAIIEFNKREKEVIPVWNKSFREHELTNTKPASVREQADKAVKTLNWNRPYYVDADHIDLNNVDLFIDSSDFFTIDIADFIGKEAKTDKMQVFVEKYSKYTGTIHLPLTGEKFEITQDFIMKSAKKYLRALEEASRIYKKIESIKGEGNFVTELSFDETEKPQSPVELLFILAGISENNIPAQTIAPKFIGRFNKSIDYIGETEKFEKEFRQNAAVIAFAISEFKLPENLKLSLHSGSDKFSIYKSINKTIKEFNTGIHVKTAGTTWLEELAGLALAGRKGLEAVKKIYKKAYDNIDKLFSPYQQVIDIKRDNLPKYEKVFKWSEHDYVYALRNNPSCKEFNPDFRQLLHISYKIAAEMGDEYTGLLEQYSDIIHENVKNNIYRHLKAIFG